MAVSSQSECAPPNGKIAFIDLAAQQARIRGALDDAIAKVLARGNYILGDEVYELEQQLAVFCGAKHCVSCANGTDALQLVLMAEDIGPGDAVIAPSFTFVATAEAVLERRATPVYADVRTDTFNLDINSLEQAIAHARKTGLTPRAVIAVDLFGLPSDYPKIEEVAAREGMIVIADGAQSFGASLDGKSVGTFGKFTTTSFFPAKPLGCYGDGGAVFTEDDDTAELLRSLRFHGKGAHKYENVRVGLNSRLDTLQAAVMLEKLKIFPEEIEKREAVAKRYNTALEAAVAVPRVDNRSRSVWAQYTVILPEGVDRDALQRRLGEVGVPTGVYYPNPLHKQGVYSNFASPSVSLANSEMLSQRVLSLPMHPYLDSATQDYITTQLLNELRIGS